MCFSKTELLHTSKVTQGHLENTTPEFIKKNEWPPPSPDCNPMDYSMGLSKEKVYQGVRDELTKQALNDRIIMSWEQIVSGRNM